MRYRADDQSYNVQIEPDGDHYRVTVEGREYVVEVKRFEAGEIAFTVNGRQRHAIIADDGTRRYIGFDDSRSDASVYVLTRDDAPTRTRRDTRSDENALTASMPGQVIKVLAAEGDQVTRGQALIVLEAMKMEIKLSAPHDGRVVKLACEVGRWSSAGRSYWNFRRSKRTVKLVAPLAHSAYDQSRR